MPEYEKMYFGLAARVADATELLIGALRRGEDEYIKEEDNDKKTGNTENQKL